MWEKGMIQRKLWAAVMQRIYPYKVGIHFDPYEPWSHRDLQNLMCRETVIACPLFDSRFRVDVPGWHFPG